jgi:hypothetical protein
MESFSEYEELEIEPSHKNPLIKIYHSFKNHQKTLETISTTACTLDFEKATPYSTPYTKSHQIYEKSCKHNSLPERLNHLKQISENKIKFMRVEKELKVASECTFKPQTNIKNPKTSLANFSKQQKEYIKSKNSNLLRLKFQYSDSPICNVPSVSKTDKLSQTVHERLYSQSRLFSKIKKKY